MKYKLILFFSFLFIISVLNAQEKDICKLELSLNGEDYEELSLRIMLANNTDYFVDGISKDKKEWIFTYPDSIYNMHWLMKLNGKKLNDSLEYKISVNIPLGSDTLKSDSFTSSKNSKVYAKFRESLKSELKNQEYYSDVYLFSNDDEVMYAAALAMNKGFSMFWRDTLDYNQRIEKYKEIASEYPDSHYLMSSLYGNLGRYNSEKDIAKIYNNFLPHSKESYLGNKIKQFTEMNFFDNSTLPNWKTNEIEPIIMDTTKYSLIVFSASWCGPCHEQIPNLKKMYGELNEKLNMVYVSIDEPETVDQWKELMINQQIPWRSLLAANDAKGLQSKYFIQSIPLAFLVHPTGKLHRLKLYEEKDVKLIYAIVNSK